ncbi:winged helix-turn-helix transcriptional regulator [Lacrimispora sp. JR3]|uniref:winged helix-turn-helix transcriptional regulator n=1 Tax=Lacrimispora sinapis TaxID=3111456 RepID=UPI00374A2A83
MSANMICNKPMHEECYMKDQCLKYNVCPMALVQELLSGKWKILILWYLSSKTLRFSEIKKRLPQVTQKMLTSQLRSLEEDRLVSRKVYPVVPSRVEYSLTELGTKIIPILELMHAFGSQYLSTEPDPGNP